MKPALKENSLDEYLRNPVSVLVIDDESSITEVLKGVLKDEGYEPHIADSGEAGIALFKKLNTPIIFLDMWMPGKDGIEVLREIKSLSPNTQVIMISGHATITNALEAMKCGAFDFVEKPFTISTITSSLIRAIDRYRVLEGYKSSDALVDSPTMTTMLESSLTPVHTEKHPGLLSRDCPGRNLGQRTINESIVLYGQCLHSGAKSGLVLEPLPRDSGIHFSHLGSSYSVPAFISNVESTMLATTVRTPHVTAATIEHLMASLHAFSISNLLIKCNGEVPIFDGSSDVFFDAIESVGCLDQGGEWYEITPKEKIVYKPSGGSGIEQISIEPSNSLIFEYTLEYPSPVGEQHVTYEFKGAESFKKHIAPARTFGFMKDVEQMQRLGLAAGGRLNNFILIGPEGIVNTELRFPDELARHKILDAMGDLFLIGRPLCAKITARMTGHADNISILRLLSETINDISS
jgi:UDP-3-O-[3-hydroxymyristoyl] N-acetylglucosamine deacetylase